MNRFAIAVTMILIAGIICGCELFTVNTSVDNSKNSLDKVVTLIEEENYNEASELSEKILKDWSKTARQLDKYLYHDYIDNITEEIAALPVYAKTKDKTAVNAQVAEIKIQLTSLKESELPYMHNIL